MADFLTPGESSERDPEEDPFLADLERFEDAEEFAHLGFTPFVDQQFRRRWQVDAEEVEQYRVALLDHFLEREERLGPSRQKAQMLIRLRETARAAVKRGSFGPAVAALKLEIELLGLAEVVETEGDPLGDEELARRIAELPEEVLSRALDLRQASGSLS